MNLNAFSLQPLSKMQPGWVVMTVPQGQEQEMGDKLADLGVAAQPDFIYPMLSTTVPNDPGYPANGGLGGDPQMVQTYLSRISAQEAWDLLSSCGLPITGAMTAVLDTGVDTEHPELQSRLLPELDFASMRPLSPDERTHGTASVGLIAAATNNGQGLAGLSWTGRHTLPIRVIDARGATTSSLVQGLQAAVSAGAGVINLSLGVPGSVADAALDEALGVAARQAVLVAAAGNTPEAIYYPANHPDVIAVGAVGDHDGALACYSARPTAEQPRPLDLVAPGGVGRSVCPEQTGGRELLVLTAGGGYGLRAGTSQAAPLVSGVAALMRAANPTLSAPQVRRLLLASADRTDGLPMLDAEKAIRSALK